MTCRSKIVKIVPIGNQKYLLNDPFSKGKWYAGQQTGSHKSLLLYINGRKNDQVYQVSRILDRFLNAPPFKIAMSGLAGDGGTGERRALGVVPGLPFGQPFFKVYVTYILHWIAFIFSRDEVEE